MSAVRGFFSGVFNFLLFDVLVLLGLIISLNLTVLNADFVTSELKKLDVYPVIIEQARTMIPGQEYIDAATVDEIVADLTPWFEEQADTVIHGVYDYVKGDQALNVNISLEPVRDEVKQKVKEAALNSLPPEYQGVPQSVIDTFMSQIYAGIDAVIPANFELNESVAGSQVMAQLQQAKEIVGYIDTAYTYFIVGAVLLILLIALAHWWQPKPIARSIGITFILVGAVCILGPLLDALIIRVLSQAIASAGVLAGLQSKLPQLAADLTAPIRAYGVGFLGSGVVLVVISFLFRTSQARPETGSNYQL
jgi:hypothetical protein